jgi:hypothetical protein
MPKERKTTTSDDKTKLNKVPKMFRLTPGTVRKLKDAALKAGRSESVYVEDALKVQFKREGIE